MMDALAANGGMPKARAMRRMNVARAIVWAALAPYRLLHRLVLVFSVPFPGATGFVLAALVYFFGAMAAEALSDWRDAVKTTGTLGAAFGAVTALWPWDARVSRYALGFLLSVIPFAFFSLELYGMRYAIFDFTVSPFNGPRSPKRPVVIMLLSEVRASIDQIRAAIQEAAEHDLVENCAPDAAAFERSVIRSWQQNLRVIKHNFVGPRSPKGNGRVIVIPSVESAPQYESFKTLVEACLAREGLGDRVKVEKARIPAKLFGPDEREGVDYRDLQDLGAALRSALAEQEAQADPVREKDICIDVTGGLKTASIAAAAATFGSQILFSYVETAPPGSREEPAINVFDVRTALRARGE